MGLCSSVSTFSALWVWRKRTFQCRMEHEASGADEKVAKISDEKDSVMTLFPTACHAFEG